MSLPRTNLLLSLTLLLILFATTSFSQFSISYRVPSSVRSLKRVPPTFLEPYNTNNSALSIPIDNVYDWYYMEEVFVGTKSLGFNLVVDTGLSYIWIPNNTLYNITIFPDTYDCLTDSTSCQILNNGSSVTLNLYQDSITGFMIQDQLEISGVLLANQDILVATQIGQVIQDFNSYFVLIFNASFDGFLGLGPNPQANGYTTFIDNLYNSGIISARWFSLYMSYDPENQDIESEITFQGYNESLISSGGFNFTQSISNTSWMIQLSDITYGGVSLNPSACPALIASGIPFIGIDVNSFRAFWNALVVDAGIACYQEASSISNDTQSIICSCSNGDLSNYPSLEFTVNGSAMQIPPEAYTMYLGFLVGDDEEDSEEAENSCMVNIYPLLYGFGFNDVNENNVWILGTPFLQSYYTIFNEDEMTIGFANSAQPSTYVAPNSSDSFVSILELVGGLLIALAVIVAIVKTCMPNTMSRGSSSYRGNVGQSIDVQHLASAQQSL